MRFGSSAVSVSVSGPWRCCPFCSNATFQFFIFQFCVIVCVIVCVCVIKQKRVNAVSVPIPLFFPSYQIDMDLNTQERAEFRNKMAKAKATFDQFVVHMRAQMARDMSAYLRGRVNREIKPLVDSTVDVMHMLNRPDVFRKVALSMRGTKKGEVLGAAFVKIAGEARTLVRMWIQRDIVPMFNQFAVVARHALPARCKACSVRFGYVVGDVFATLLLK